jgi:hypothetical protein
MSLLKDMAINNKTLKYIKNMIKKSGYENIENLSMCELGSQIIPCRPDFKSAKDYFEYKGVKHTSIDLNGEHGSLKLDLCKKIEIGQYDIVTNLGVSEHVEDEEMCFENIHNFCRVGGVMIHVLPAENNWLKHKCYRRYNLGFFRDLSKRNNYEIIDLSKESTNNKKKHIYCTLRREK